MPMFKTGCACGYRGERYLHHEFNRQLSHPCPECRHELVFLPSYGTALTWFEEGRARVIHNMGDEPVVITSHSQYEKEMKKRGLANAGSRRGMPGCWA